MARIWNKHKQTNTPLKRKVFVAMSGGVDSSVAAALLKERGFDARGCYLKISPNIGEGCAWHADRRDAMRVAQSQLGIPFEWLDFSEEYKRLVFEPMVAAYQRGITPNPDIWCNREIKFGIFKEAMRHLGADKIATGHYARIEKKDDGYHLLKARDTTKDQSYFLWTLAQEDLSHALFPIGDYMKTGEVRAMARKFGLVTAEKKDSQDLCMVGPLDFKEVLRQFVKEPHRGRVIDTDTGAVFGNHDGLEFYTIGERSGFGDGNGALYVARKNMRTGDMFVVPKEHPALFSKSATIASVNWISGAEPVMPFLCEAVARYHAKPVAAKVTKVTKDTNVSYKAEFAEPQYAVTPGQSFVLYQGEELIGGGVIQ